MVIAVGIGLAGLVHAAPRLHTILRYAGAAYLLYLAWCIARAEASSGGSMRAKPIGFLEAMLFQGINPKGWVFATLSTRRSRRPPADPPNLDRRSIRLVRDYHYHLSRPWARAVHPVKPIASTLMTTRLRSVFIDNLRCATWETSHSLLLCSFALFIWLVVPTKATLQIPVPGDLN
jgi:hypothetical protein